MPMTMNVHLVRSGEYPRQRFKTIIEILKDFTGPVKFLFRDEDIAEDMDDEEEEYDGSGDYGNRIGNELYGNIKLEWSEHFKKCEEFRKQNEKIKDDELVVLFTDYGNKDNWFSSWDPSGKLNFFIQTSRWDDYVDARSCFPIIYELATIPLIISTWKNLEEVIAASHKEPRGCPLDYCGEKKQIELRLRTGDVCPDCLKEIKSKGIDPKLARQVFDILDHVRDQVLFRKRFDITGQPSRINIETETSRLVFLDMGNIPVRLAAREMTFFLFFLWHPEGVKFNDLHRHKDELRRLYEHFSRDASLTSLEDALLRMIRTDGQPNSRSEVVSRIKAQLSYAIGEELAPFYLIDRRQAGRKGEYIHFIGLDRELVTINRQPFNPNRPF